MNADRTFFVTTVTSRRRSLFQTDRMAALLIDTLFEYRRQGKYLLHEFVIMPDHVHLLLTPADEITLEKSMQMIKGGFSFRAGKLISRMELWERSFTNHRVRNREDYSIHKNYILQNPVRRGLSELPEAYPWCSVAPGFILDAPPQGLKPLSCSVAGCWAEALRFHKT